MITVKADRSFMVKLFCNMPNYIFPNRSEYIEKF